MVLLDQAAARWSGMAGRSSVFGKGFSLLLSAWTGNWLACKSGRVQLSEAYRGLRVSRAGSLLLNLGRRRWLITLSEEATSYAPGTQIHASFCGPGEQPAATRPPALGELCLSYRPPRL